ncbi:MAG: cell wall-active antibiotics response protein [Bacteroidetes bacterium]|nr:cell wall-active antibiotics response protein [Bacteroidota bacterium]
MDKNSLLSTRVVIGAILIVLGGLFLLDNYDIIYFELPDFIFEWQMIFIIIGLILLSSTRDKTAGLIFLAIGLFNYYPELWPLILVIIGLSILFKKKTWSGHFGRKGSEGTTDKGSIDDFIEDVSVFGGGSKVFHSDNFKGGRIVAIFGGSEIRLTECQLAEGDNVLEITALFGGSTILVPRDWNVNIDVTPIFGGFGDKRIKDPNLAYDKSKRLTIRGVVIFGGGEIKSF